MGVHCPIFLVFSVQGWVFVVLPSLCLVSRDRVDFTCSIVYGRTKRWSRQSNCPDSLCNFWMNPMLGTLHMCDNISVAVTSVSILGLHRVGEVAAEGKQPTVTWPQTEGVTFDVSHSQGSECVTRPKFVSLTHFHMCMDAYVPTHCIACSHIHLLQPLPPPPTHTQNAHSVAVLQTLTLHWCWCACMCVYVRMQVCVSVCEHVRQYVGMYAYMCTWNCSPTHQDDWVQRSAVKLLHLCCLCVCERRRAETEPPTAGATSSPASTFCASSTSWPSGSTRARWSVVSGGQGVQFPMTVGQSCYAACELILCTGGILTGRQL